MLSVLHHPADTAGSTLLVLTHTPLFSPLLLFSLSPALISSPLRPLSALFPSRFVCIFAPLAALQECRPEGGGKPFFLNPSTGGDSRSVSLPETKIDFAKVRCG
jgi:hypothetical protein